MADKQLNFNRPLLSVRRFSSPVTSQTDSRRKPETSLPEKPPIPSYKPESNSGSLRNPGSVPFVWEYSPGRPKDEAKNPKERPPVVPKLPPGRTSKHKKQDLDKMTEVPNAKKGPRKHSLGSRSEEKLTTFESSKETKKVTSDSRDDICVLPAKNAVNSETVKEKPLEAKKAVNRDDEKPQVTYGPNFLQFTGDDSEEDSNLDYDEHENMSYKVCGLLPHFCLKGSIGLLNPIPGLSVRTRLPISSAKDTCDWPPSVTSQKASVNHQKDRIVMKNESTKANNQKKLQKLQGSELDDRCVISYNLSSERKDVSFQKNGLVSFKELLLADQNEKEADSLNKPAVEKTVYIDTIHKVETAKSNSHSSSPKGKSNLEEPDVGVLEMSDIPTKSLQFDFLADKPKQDKEMKTQTGFSKDPKVDQDLKASKISGLELPATPPLPKSPSDSWLWRTLPSVSSKTASLRSNPKYPSPKIAESLDKNVQLRPPKGLLHPIPET